MEANTHFPGRRRRALILCFDGTGNKFQGNSGDSNIIKIFSMIDRQSASIHSYYQPGIGTYIEDSALSKTSHLARLRSWYLKAKDQAVGTSFDRHVMGGYEFLMENYEEGDDIYFFGFSRGAYIARFLAQMLDSVGLLSRGNDQMLRFAWKAFAEWQTRLDETPEQKKKKKETYEFLRAFRETFSRPNSVPRFETAWLKRARYPYTSKSSAKIIRHAVAIDERRAKFRQNLISQKKGYAVTANSKSNGAGEKDNDRPTPPQRSNTADLRFKPRRNALAPPVSKTVSRMPSNVSINSTTAAQEPAFVTDEEEDDELEEQDVQEIWFPGCHADIGGGWPEPGMRAGLSHAPLLWMIREARKAGMPFDESALQDAGFFLDDLNLDPITEPNFDEGGPPEIRIDGEQADVNANSFKQACDLLHAASTQGMIHDSLSFKRGTPGTGVLAWKAMEYLPFRRMDLRDDGTWAPIRWPLPCGEVRDIPKDAWVHSSALKRMDHDPSYRPGNLIIGGGGRGVKVAPEHYGKGSWKILREHGNPVGEVLLRADVLENGC
ncbi:MAG: hypothetical protein Q9162_006915 [Coniocarpon cinnabarinum]